MNGKPVNQKRRKYDAEFKAEVLKMVESGQSVPELSKKHRYQRFCIRWLDAV
jgi:transposase-like protein